MVAELRRSGENISQIVRVAIRQRHNDALPGVRTAAGLKAFFKSLDAEVPLSADKQEAGKRRVNVHDRAELAAAIRAKVASRKTKRGGRSASESGGTAGGGGGRKR